MNSDTLQMVAWGVGLLLAVWIPTFGVTFLVMSSRHKKKAATPEQMGTDAAAAAGVSLAVALLVSMAIVAVIGVCVVVAVVGFIAAACGGH